MERSGGGRENEGILYAMHIKKQFDCNGIASLAVKNMRKKNVQRCRPPKLRFSPYIGGGLVVLGSERAVVFADLTAPAVVIVSMWSIGGVRVG